MTIEEIMEKKKVLDMELQIALSTMEKKDTLQLIKQRIEENQQMCPHFSAEYNLERHLGHCPYCGKKVED